MNSKKHIKICAGLCSFFRSWLYLKEHCSSFVYDFSAQVEINEDVTYQKQTIKLIQMRKSLLKDTNRVHVR